MQEPRAGDFFVTEIRGRGHKYVVLGQAIIGDASRYSHAGIVLDNNQVIEAMPGGAILTPLSYYIETMQVARVTRYCTWDLTETNRFDIVYEARKLVGTKYSWLDYLSLGLTHMLPFQPKRLRRYVANSGHMICSQLVDEVYLRAGLHMFYDKRPAGDVTPGDLSYILNGPEDGVTNG